MTDRAPENAAPIVTDETVENWGMVDTVTGQQVFTDHDRASAERRLWKLSKDRPTLVLARRDVRVRQEKWLGEVEVVPWHSPCDWVAPGDENGNKIGDAWCGRHQHSEGTPVPPEHIRGGPLDA